MRKRLMCAAALWAAFLLPALGQVNQQVIPPGYFGMGFGQPKSIAPISGSVNLPAIPCPGAHTVAQNANATCGFQTTEIRNWDAFLNSSGSRWANIETARGTFNWNQVDPWVTAASAQGANILFVLGMTPAWANGSIRTQICQGTLPNGTAYEAGNVSCTNSSGQAVTVNVHSGQYPPDDVFSSSGCTAPATGAGDCDWKTFVYNLMQHAGCNAANQAAGTCAGKLVRIEIWNEPNSCNPLTQYASCVGTTNVKALMTMQRDAYQIVKAFNPGIEVIMSGGQGHGSGLPANGSAGWVAKMLCVAVAGQAKDAAGCAAFPQGVGPYTDAISVHLYGLATPETLIPWLSTIRANIPTTAGSCGAVACSTLPIYNTETGQDYSTATGSGNWAGAASYLSRSFLLGWASGVARYYWYSEDGDKNGTLWWITGHTPLGAGTLEPSSPTSTFPNAPAGLNYPGMAYALTAQWMTGAVMNQLCASDVSGTLWTCGFTRTNGYSSQAVWSSNGTQTYVVPAGFTQARDLLGNVTQLGSACVLLANCQLSITGSPQLLENFATSSSCGGAGQPACPPPSGSVGQALSGRGLTVAQ